MLCGSRRADYNSVGVPHGFAPMNDSLRIRLGAVLLALFTLAAVIFGLLNLQQRSRFDSPDDGVSWLDTPEGVQAWHISSNSPAAKAGIKPGDILTAVNGTEIRRAVQVTEKLWKAGLWSEVRYRMVRAGREFEAPLITVPAQKPFSIENYLRVVGLLYLFIGLFIFARRWNASRAVHFYIFCLVSFVLYSFHYTGKRSEEHTSELQSRGHLVCRLLLEKKNNKHPTEQTATHHFTEQLHNQN